MHNHFVIPRGSWKQWLCKIFGSKQGALKSVWKWWILCLWFKKCYYSFKMFLRFWLAKIPCIIHHNQLLLTQFGRRLGDMWKMTSIVQQNCQIFEPVNQEDHGMRLSCFGSDYKMVEHFPHFRRKKSENIARTARRQLDGRHLLFGEYLQTWETLFL